MRTKKNWKWEECTKKYYTNPKQKKATLLSVKENLETIKISRNEKRHFKMKKETKDLRDNTIVNLCASKKIPWTRKWQPIPVFLPGKFHWQRSYSPWGCKRVEHNSNKLGTKYTKWNLVETKMAYVELFIVRDTKTHPSITD